MPSIEHALGLLGCQRGTASGSVLSGAVSARLMQALSDTDRGVLYHYGMKFQRHSGRLAKHADRLAHEDMRRPAPKDVGDTPEVGQVVSGAGADEGDFGGPREPWTDRHAETLIDLDGNEWAVIVDWAERPDETRVPASVTLTSLGGTLTDDPAPGAEPRAVTATLLRQVNWAEVFKRSRTEVTESIPASWRSQQYAAPSPKSSHDDLLRSVADLYREVTLHKNPSPAKDVHARLELDGVKPRGGGPLSEETVRRWIKEARQRGYLPPHKTPGSTEPEDK